MKMKLNLLCAASMLVGCASFAQMPGPGSPGGLSSALTKLFGETTAFNARAEVQVLDKSNQETMKVPMNFALLDNKVRVEIDMTQMKNRAVSEAAIAQFKKMGMSQVISIIRPDKKFIYVVYPDQKSLLAMPMTKEDSDAAEGTPKIEKTALGKETIDGHPCIKNKVTLRDDKGQTTDAITWNATDLKDFPVQIQTKENENTTLVHYKQIQIGKPDGNQFEPPAGYAQYNDVTELMDALVKKGLGPDGETGSKTQKPAPK